MTRTYPSGHVAPAAAPGATSEAAIPAPAMAGKGEEVIPLSESSGTDRPLWDALLARLDADDTLTVWKVDRLGRSTLDALQAAKDLDARGVRIVITTLGIDLKTSAGRLVFGMMCQIAEFEHELIRERVIAGLAAAKKRGVSLGRRHTLKPHQRAEAVRMHLEEGKSIGSIAALFGCGRTVVHRAVKAAE